MPSAVGMPTPGIAAEAPTPVLVIVTVAT